MAIGIVWIGLCIDPDENCHEHQKLLKELKVERPPAGIDESEFFQRFELTHEGEPICINEYATRIARSKGTHVIHINEFLGD